MRLPRRTSFILAAASRLSAAALAKSKTARCGLAGWMTWRALIHHARPRCQKDHVDIWASVMDRDSGALAAFERGAEEGEDAEIDPLLGPQAAGTGSRCLRYDGAGACGLRRTEQDAGRQPEPPRRPRCAFRRQADRAGVLSLRPRPCAALETPARQATFLNDWARTQPVPEISLAITHSTDMSSRPAGPASRGVEPRSHRGSSRNRLVKTQASDSFNTVLDLCSLRTRSWAATGERDAGQDCGHQARRRRQPSDCSSHGSAPA